LAATRILLADDHAILRSGLQMLVHSRPDLEVVAQASDAEEAIAKAQALRPDLAILDVSMPGGGPGGDGGVRAAEEIARTCPGTRIIALTMHDDQSYLKAMITAGASGFVVKASADTRLIDAIETVMKGQVYIDPAMGERVMRGLLHPHEAAPEPSGPQRALDELSLRERQVLQLLAHGYTNREAADELGLSMRSVETYRSRTAEKLGFQSKVDLVKFAIEVGLLQVGQAGPPPRPG
jgi:two-component system response regulator NreC